jgi:hypothetical protein
MFGKTKHIESIDDIDSRGRGDVEDCSCLLLQCHAQTVCEPYELINPSLLFISFLLSFSASPSSVHAPNTGI